MKLVRADERETIGDHLWKIIVFIFSPIPPAVVSCLDNEAAAYTCIPAFDFYHNSVTELRMSLNSSLILIDTRQSNRCYFPQH